MAEKRGLTPSQYGFTFGIPYLAAFIFSPIIGTYGGKIGPKTILCGGAFIQAVVAYLFGLLDFIEPVWPFLMLSYLLRFIEGIGTAAHLGAALAILIDLFPDRVATYMSYTEVGFGLGYMLGPPLGSHLYELGGLLLPFEVVGIILVIASLAVYYSLPTWINSKKVTIEIEETKRIKWSDVMRVSLQFKK